MDHQLWIHSQDLDFMTAAIVLICSPPQSAPNNLRLLHLTLHCPTLTLHWFLRAFCLQLHCAQETEIQQNQLLCVGSRRRQGRMQAFHRHQSSMYNCQHCLHCLHCSIVASKESLVQFGLKLTVVVIVLPTICSRPNYHAVNTHQ